MDSEGRQKLKYTHGSQQKCKGLGGVLYSDIFMTRDILIDLFYGFVDPVFFKFLDT